MDHVKAHLDRLLGNRRFVPLYLATSLALGAILVAYDTWPARMTDEDEYVSDGFDDLLNGRNPYATGRAADHSIDLTCTWHDVPRCWYSLPYLPLTLILHIPFIDYRWTALVAFGLLAWAVRDRAWPFLALANPFVLWLAVSGFTDLVVVALMAWSLRLRRPWIAWFAAGAKQFALPLLIALYAWRRQWTEIVIASGFTLLVILPFVLWDPAAFWYWAVEVHIAGTDHKWWGLLGVGHANYLLYYAFVLTVLYPAARDARVGVDPAVLPAAGAAPAPDDGQ
jgi:hypothetical protein